MPISDLSATDNQGNILTDFSSQEGEPSKRKLVFYGADGQVIKDRSNNPIVADSAIAATGFRSKLDSIIENYATEKSDGKKEELRKSVSLPTNEKISVAETLTSDSSVLILGTASKSEFESVDKLAQLPVEAREALLRNGAENAVAIGFRAPDTQAAVNIWLNSQDIHVEKKSATTTRKELVVNGQEDVVPGPTFWLERGLEQYDNEKLTAGRIQKFLKYQQDGEMLPEEEIATELVAMKVGDQKQYDTPDGMEVSVRKTEGGYELYNFIDDIKVPNNIKDEIRILSPLFVYNIGNSIELVSSDGKRFNGELNFTLTYNIENQMLGLRFDEDKNIPVSREVIEAIKTACMDDDFQKYALVSLQKKRRNPKLDLVLSFKDGFIDPKTTFVQD